MNTPDSKIIVKRFFDTLYYLKQQKIIRGKATFTNAHDINRWNLNYLEKHPESNMFQVSWLTYLVQDYGVSSKWLLTGIGPILAPRVRQD